MYDVVLLVHSWFRWAALATAVAGVVMAWQSKSAGQPWRKGPGLAMIIGYDLQLTLGILLLLVSPLASVAFSDMKAAMKDPTLRFFVVEHPSQMIVATALAHVGFARAKRAADAPAAWQAQFTFGAIALLLMLAAIPWPFRAIGRTLLRLP